VHSKRVEEQHKCLPSVEGYVKYETAL